jgi:hypothetical protein
MNTTGHRLESDRVNLPSWHPLSQARRDNCGEEHDYAR